jgi:hypothetical protein
MVRTLTDATIVGGSNDRFPARPPTNPLRKVVPCPGCCFWLEEPRIDCPFIRIFFCPNLGHGNYLVEFGPDNNESCPKCRYEKDHPVVAGEVERMEGRVKKWCAKVTRKFQNVKAARRFSFAGTRVGMNIMVPSVACAGEMKSEEARIKEWRAKIAEKLRKAKARRRCSFPMGPVSGMSIMVTY